MNWRHLIQEARRCVFRDEPPFVQRPSSACDYRIAVRPFDDSDEDRADDVVVNDVDMFRLEQMDDKVWFACCYLAGEDPGNRIAFDIRWVPKLRNVVVTVTEWPTGVVYEGVAEQTAGAR